MMRFTETGKWEDAWFYELSPEHKLAWLYILDKCDNSGVIELVPSLANAMLGMDVDWDAFQRAAGERIHRMSSGKWWIKPFVTFQVKGQLSGRCKPHQSIIKLLQKHGLWTTFLEHYPQDLERVSIPLAKGKERVQEKEKEKEKDKEKDKEKEKDQPKRRFQPPTVEEVADYCRKQNHAVDAEEFVDYHASQGWKKSNGQPVKDWRACVRNWSRSKGDAAPKEVLPVKTARRRA